MSSSVDSVTAKISSAPSPRKLRLIPKPGSKGDAAPSGDDASKMKIKRLTPSARKEIDLKNHARKLAGLSLIQIKTRKCIACGKTFESAGNRTCGCQSRRAGFIAGREII